MSIVYEITWYYNAKTNPWLTDEFPVGVEVVDMELQKSTTRQQVFRYELADEQDAYRLETQLDYSGSVIRCKRLVRGKLR